MSARSTLARLLGQGRPDSVAALFHGGDEGGIAAEVTRLKALLGEGCDVVTVTDGQLRDDRGALAGAAGSRSLFGGETLVLHPMEEPSRTATALEALLTLAGEPNPVIVTAGTLTPKNKALAVAKSDPRVHVREFRPLGASDMERLIRDAAGAQGLSLDAPALDRLLAEVGVDRRLATMEVDKLALLLDAAPDRPTIATLDDVDAIVSGSAAAPDAFPVADWLLTGQRKALSDWLGEASSTDLGNVVRALTRRAQQMVAIAGRSSDSGAMRRAGAFGAAETVLRRLDRRLPAPRLARLAGALGELEALTRTSRADADTALRQRMLGLADRLG